MGVAALTHTLSALLTVTQDAWNVAPACRVDVRAVFDFAPTHAGDLGFEAGDLIRCELFALDAAKVAEARAAAAVSASSAEEDGSAGAAPPANSVKARKRAFRSLRSFPSSPATLDLRRSLLPSPLLVVLRRDREL